MNIKQAKEQIKKTMTVYFKKDEYGEYVIPIERQRPVFLIGPPGIGKTAIMEQIAHELGVAIISYSMTHHTRQSSLGLPIITRKKYDGKEYEVSEYTMSEIIASIYDKQEETGLKEGILFLDEINCVSETLAPIILQFLQYKVFGKHRVPEGWIIVTAGNPPEYNNSVREFDIVTWDRLKRIDVEPDYDVWKEYAYRIGVHPVVISYLEAQTNDFYLIESTVDGKLFITARGWVDLSEMIKLYEENSIEVDENLAIQYIQYKKIARKFIAFYKAFNKYRTNQIVNRILDGKIDNEIEQTVISSNFSEKISLIGLLLDSIFISAKELSLLNDVSTNIYLTYRTISKAKPKESCDIDRMLLDDIDKYRSEISSGLISNERKNILRNTVKQLLNIKKEVNSISEEDCASRIKSIKKELENFDKMTSKEADSCRKKMTNVLSFFADLFSDKQELLILVTELTVNPYSAEFIVQYGCDEYFKHNKDLLFHEREQMILSKIKQSGENNEIENR